MLGNRVVVLQIFPVISLFDLIGAVAVGVAVGVGEHVGGGAVGSLGIVPF